MMRAWLAIGLLAASTVAGCSDGGRAQAAKSAPPAPIPVGVTKAEQKAVPLQVVAVGTVQAYTTVGVKSQVAGQIQSVHFTEGDEVKRGDLLFTIDPRPMEAAVRQAEANVAKDRAQFRQAEAARGQRQAEITQAQANLDRDLAQLANARVQEQRYSELVRKELVAREQYDQIRTAMAAFEATVQADRAAVENSRAAAQAAEAMVDNARAAISANEAMVETVRLQLAYTTIRAPMDGRTGNLLVQAGNVLKTGEDSPLVVIAQIRPIYVSFSVPEHQLSAIKTYRAKGTVRVEAMLEGGRKSVVGAVTFVNNTVDPTTGTIQLKATFANADSVLWPGQFVDVGLTLTTEQATVVPVRAVQAGQKGPFVFVVKPDLTVESRPVKPGRRLATEVVIDQGVAPGERIVTDGHLRLLPGTRVEIRPEKTS
jgi:multidrug efflux system membrane fusion protein